MKIKFRKIEKGRFKAGVYRGRGGVSSLVCECTGTFWHAIRAFHPKYIWRALIW